MMIIKTLMGLLVCVAVGVAYLYFPLQWRRHKDIEHGNTLITNVQQYRAKYFKFCHGKQWERWCWQEHNHAKFGDLRGASW